MKAVKILVCLLAVLVLGVSVSSAQFSVGADLVSRYLWRGWDFGNSAAVQPALAYSAPAGTGSFEIGAWGSFGIAGGIGTSDAYNENDLYASYSNGPVSVVFTDYFFPGYSGDDQFDEFGKDGAHILELGASAGNEIVSGSVYYAFSTPTEQGIEKSWYLELGVTPPYEVDDIGISLFIGAGNGFYDFVEDGAESKFVISNLGVTVNRGMFSTTWAMNPDQKTTFLVFMMSL